MFRTIIWATDGADEADHALAAAVELAEAGGGRIVAVHANQRLTGRAGAWPALPDEIDRLRKIRRQVTALRASGLDAELVVRRTHRTPAAVVAVVARETGADVIVCGTLGRSSVGGAVLGSVAHELLHVAPCPVFAVPARASAKAKVAA
jgi:nucleotide-binding universal stress UspA family protein